jgi:hypothetical protein
MQREGMPSGLSSSNQTDFRIVAGLLADLATAKNAMRDLRGAGVADDRIGLALRKPEEQAASPDGSGQPAREDAATGAIGGGIIGGLTGLLAASGLIMIPGLAPLLAGGALASALGVTGASVVTGAGVGAATGGLVGGLISINVPESAARRYDEGVRQGLVLITVQAHGPEQAAAVETILKRYGAETETGS